MKKHILRKLLSSIFSSDDDDTQLVQGNEEMTNKVEKILELINALEKGDQSQDGPELVSLVENFYKDYQELYGRYDNLVEKLKKCVHKGNEMNGEASGIDSSSESDSSDSDGNKEETRKIRQMEFEETKASFHQYEALQKELDGLKVKNKDLEMEATSMLIKLNEVEKNYCELMEKKTALEELENKLSSMKESRKVLEDDNERLKLELEISIQQKEEVNEGLKSIHEENEALILEKSSALNSVEVLKIEVDNLKDVVSKFHNEGGVLERELESTSKRVSDLHEQLDISNEEKNALSLEKSTVLSRIGEAEKYIEDLKNEAGANLELANRRSSENAQLLVEIGSLSHKLEEAEKVRGDLSKELFVTKEESCNLSFEISKIQKQMKESLKVVEDLKYELASKIDLNNEKSLENATLLMDITNLKLEFEAADKEKSYLHKELNVAKEESSYLSSEILRIQKQIDDAEKVIENLKHEASTSMELADKKNSQLLLEIESLNHKLEAADKERSGLKKEITVAEERISDLHSQISKLSKHIEEEEKLIENLNSESGASLELANKRSSENAQLLLEIESLKLNLEADGKERSNLNKDLATAKEESFELSTKISIIKLQIDEADKTIENLKAECGELKANEFKLLDENKHLSHELRVNRDEVRRLSMKHTELVDEIRLAREVGDGLSAKVEMLNKEKFHLLNDHEALKMEVKASHGKIAELEKRLEQSQAERNSLVVTNEILISEKSSLLTRLDDTEKSTDELKTERDVLNNETIELQTKNASLKQEMEESARRVFDLTMQLTMLHGEKDALNLEKVAFFSKIEQDQKDIENFKNEARENLILANKRSAEIADLIQERDHLGSKMAEAEQLKISLVQELATVKEEGESLKSEISSTRLQMQEIEKTTEELRSYYDLSKDDNSKLVAINTELNEKVKGKDDEIVALSLKHTESISKIQQLEECSGEQLKSSNEEKAKLLADYECLKSERESADLKISELIRMLDGMQEEKQVLSSENAQLLNKIQQLEKMMNDLQSEIEHGKCNNLELEKRLEVKEDEVIVLGEKLEEVQIEASNNINTMQGEVDIILSQNSELKEQVVTVTKELSEIKILKEKMESEFAEKISEQAASLDENQNKFNDLMTDYQIIEDQFRQSCIKLDTVENRIVELEATIGCKEMEKANADKEKEKLQEQVKSLEVQFRLVNQKLKITETEHRAKEKDNESRMNELLEDKSGLQEQIEVLYRKAIHLEIQTKEILAIELDRLSDVVYNIEITFDNYCADFQAKLVNFFEDLRTMKGTTKALVSKMQDLENEKLNLIATVEQNNGSFSRLKEDVAVLQMKLVEKTKEEERLRDKTVQYQSKLMELQKTLEEKEEEGRFKDEEKREAIRQLCYQIEYHREKWDNMFHLVSENVKKSQQ